VLHFLRDGMLPQDPKLLRALYLESEFWKIDSLRKAIEMKNMELLQIKQDNDAKTAAAAAATLLASHPGGAQGKYHLDSALASRVKASSSTVADPAKGSDAAWWLQAPTWWGPGDKKEPKLVAVAAAAMKRAQLDGLEASRKDENEIDAWWKAATYKGRDFTQTLDKTKRAEDDGSGTPRSPLLLSSTWPSTH
jgi:hypothetical protein